MDDQWQEEFKRKTWDSKNLEFSQPHFGVKSANILSIFFLLDLTGDSVHAASIENNVNLDKALK